MQQGSNHTPNAHTHTQEPKEGQCAVRLRSAALYGLHHEGYKS